MPWIAASIFLALIATFDIIGRYFRFKREPERWTSRALLRDTGVRTLLLLVWVLFMPIDQELRQPYALLVLLFSVIYFGVVWLVGQRVLQSTPGRREA